MYVNILDETRLKLIYELDKLSFISRFTMGGGTALSLQLGIRKSYDFDFFSNWHFPPDALLKELRDHFEQNLILINQETKLSTLDLYIQKVQVSFFEYDFPELETKSVLVPTKQIFFSLADIACMKAVAILQRGTKKDFFDLYFLLKTKSRKAKRLKDLLEAKYQDKNLLANFCYSVGYFEDAEADVLPESYVDYSWSKIKKFFIQFQNDFYQLL